MAFVEKTIAEMEAMTRVEKKAYFEGDGKPPQPTGYAGMAADDSNKLAFDESLAQNLLQIAGIDDAIANAD